MSANTYWRPAQKGKCLPCLSSFLDVIGEALDYGRVEGELSLSGRDVPMLKGIAAADKTLAETVAILLDALQMHEVIHLWREY